MDAACGDNAVARLDAFAEFLDFVLAFLLRTNHEEVEDGDKSHDHEDVHQTGIAAVCLKQDGVENHIL